jgi:hypothetical protein
MAKYKFKGFRNGSFIEIEVLLGPANDSLVSLVEVLLSDHVSILANRLHAGLLANAGNISSADLIGTTHVLLQINVLGKVHFGCNGLED